MPRGLVASQVVGSTLERTPSMNEDDIPDYDDKPIRVTVVDFDMKFGSMVAFAIKLGFALSLAAILVTVTTVSVLRTLGALVR